MLTAPSERVTIKLGDIDTADVGKSKRISTPGRCQY